MFTANTKRTTPLLVTMLCTLTMTTPAPLFADGDQNGWSGGDKFTATGSPGGGVDFLIGSSKNRSVNFFADELLNSENRDGVAGADNYPYYTGLEVYHVDNRSQSNGGINNSVNVGAGIHSFLTLNDYKAVATQGLVSAAISHQPDSIGSGSTSGSARSSLIGMVSYAGTYDASDFTPPWTYRAGFFDRLIGSIMTVEMDSVSKEDSSLPHVLNDTTGIEVNLLNGVGSNGQRGVYANDVIGIDLNFRVGVEGEDPEDDHTQVRSYRGIRVNYPERSIAGDSPEAIVYDCTNRSYGILLESAANATTNGVKTTAIPTTTKYAGLRAEAPVEIADALIQDPIESVVVGAASGVVLPIDRATLWVKVSTGHGTRTVNTSDCTLPNGTPGQRLTVFVEATGSDALSFNEWSGTVNLNLSTVPRTLQGGDILELLFMNGKWHEVSFSNN